MSAEQAEENPPGRRRRLPKLKNPVKIWKNRRQQDHGQTAEAGGESEEVLLQEEQLDDASRRLIQREEQLFSQDSPSEEEEERLQEEYEALKLQMWMVVNNTFACSSSPSSSGSSLELLKSAVTSIQQQEVQDRRWVGCLRVPMWRPQKCLSTHNGLLQKMVETRLVEATEEDSSGADGLSSPLKREVFLLGRRVKEDLLMVARAVKDCYPPQMDIVNLYAGLFHQNFSARLTGLVASGPDADDCRYLLFWINHYYPHEILKHEDLEGKIKSACLGSLLPQDQLDHLEDQYLAHKEDKVKSWLNAALKKEEESWLSSGKPELIDDYCFSPLAVDAIQMIDASLTEFSRVIRDQQKAEGMTAHLEAFVSSYKKSVEEFVKGNPSNVRSVVKAQLVCEQQLRDYITGQTGSLPAERTRRCLDTLSALRDCGYSCLTGPIHVQLKTCFSSLWTSGWLDGSCLVVDSLLDSLTHHLSDLTDLKPACRQALLCVVHQDVVLRYVKRMMKTGTKSREQQVGGAERMIEDAQKMDDFFNDGDCGESRWLGELLRRLAEVLRLQDPGSIQLEMVSMARASPDLSDAHVAALLSLKNGLSAADVRSIRKSVAENRCSGVPANHSPPFFSKVQVKWINSKINQIQQKTGINRAR